MRGVRLTPAEGQLRAATAEKTENVAESLQGGVDDAEVLIFGH
jgi:hypothetical protein